MPLEKLLDTSSFRRLQLIELLVYDDIWWKIENLSDHLNCSRRTMIADIKTINSLSGEDFFIKTSKQRGVKLIASDMFHMDEVYQYLMENSLNFQIIKKIIELDCTNNQNLSELLFTSQSSINRSLKQINHFLMEYELEIQSNPIKITGTEKQIRYFFSIFLCEYYSFNMSGFQHPIKNIASEFIKQLEKERESSPHSFLTHYRILIWLVICADRVSKGYFIEDTYEFPEIIRLKMEQPLIGLIEKLPFELPDKEIKFMLYIYWNNYRDFNTSELTNDPSLDLMYQSILSFVEQLKKETGYAIDDLSFLITNLMGYCFYRNFFKGPSYLLVDPKREIIGTTIKPFEEFSKTVKKIISQQPKGSWIHETKDTDFIFVLILFWKGLVAQVLSNKEKVQILVVSYVGIQQELLLIDILEAHFPLVVECYSASKEGLLSKNVELILTDHQVKWTKQSVNSSKKVVGIGIIPTNRDWKRIEQMIEKIQLEKKMKINEPEQKEDSF